MRAWKSETHFRGFGWVYGYREEAVSLFDLIRRKGIACTDAICMGVQRDPREKQSQIPTESALAVEKGWPIPSSKEMFEPRLFFYHQPKPLLSALFPRKNIFSLAPRSRDSYCDLLLSLWQIGSSTRTEHWTEAKARILFCLVLRPAKWFFRHSRSNSSVQISGGEASFGTFVFGKVASGDKDL